jgi:hypothetical protein
MKITAYSDVTPDSMLGNSEISEESLALLLYLEVKSSTFLRIYVLDYTVSH